MVANLITVIAFVIGADKTMAIGREGSRHILGWVTEMNRRDFGNGENN